MLKLILKYLLYLCAFASFIMLLPGSILLDIKPKAFFHPLPKTLTGALQPNERLSSTEKLFEDTLLGPESLAVFNGNAVTGSADGFIYQIDGHLKLKPLIKLVEKSCALNPHNASRCGRPLGLQFDSKGTLYVVEPSIGVFAIEEIFKRPKPRLVFDIEQTSVLGKSSKFLDDLTIDEGSGLNGGHVLYISDVSDKFELFQCGLIIAGSEMGRLIKYDINAKKVESIAENLLFPNGVQITDDRNAILVNEFVSRQVVKAYIKGPKKGETEVIVKHLPGEPDNIRRSASKKETYWLALFSGRTTARQNELDYYLKKPLLRKLVCRLFHMFGSGIEYMGNLFRVSMIAEFGYDLKNGKQIFEYIFDNNSEDYAMIVEIDVNGEIVDSLQASDRSLTRLSEVREVRINENETVLYLGSYINDYLGKLVLKR